MKTLSLARQPTIRRVLGAAVVSTMLSLASFNCAQAQPNNASAKLSVSDKEIVRRFYDAFEPALIAQAKTGTTKKFSDMAEALRFLESLTPVSFRPAPSAFASLITDLGGGEQFVVRMPLAMQAETKERDLRAAQMLKHLEPVMKQVLDNIGRQFPLKWQTDPTATLAQAKADRKPAVILFCAEWSAACKPTLMVMSTGRVNKLLNESFVAADVDMTDNTSPAVEKYQSIYKVQGVPLTLVFDRTGKEIARLNGVPDAAVLTNAVEKAAAK